MPFEGQMQAFDVASFSPGVEGLRKLSWLLRHPELWPAKDFEWDFTEILSERIIEKKVRVGFFHSVIDFQHCGSKGCALGLAMTMWPTHCILAPAENNIVLQIIDAGQRWFGMPHDDARRIFSYDGYEDDVTPTPADVADAIDAYLAQRAQEIETYG